MQLLLVHIISILIPPTGKYYIQPATAAVAVRTESSLLTGSDNLKVNRNDQTSTVFSEGRQWSSEIWGSEEE